MKIAHRFGILTLGCGATRSLAAVLMLALALTALPGESAMAEEEERVRAQALSERVYRRLAEAQERTEEDNWAGARRILEEILEMPRLTSYERAQVYNFFGYVYYGKDNLERSIEFYERVLQEEDTDRGLRENTTYTLAQLYFTVERWAKAAELVEKFLEGARNPGPDPFILLGSAYYNMERYRDMIRPIERAIEVARERDREVREQWWLLLRVAYFELEDWNKVRDILEILVTTWPKREYWMQLAAIYYELGDTARQLAAFESAYDQGLLRSGRELRQLAQLLMIGGAPYKAGQVLSQGIEDGLLEDDDLDTLRLISQAWNQAREYQRAIEPLRAAARLSREGELDVRLAQSYMYIGEYRLCVDAAREGIRKGGLSRVDQANIVLGTCLYETDAFEEAKTAFDRASNDQRSARTANQWIRFIENEQERIRQLQESMRALGPVS